MVYGFGFWDFGTEAQGFRGRFLRFQARFGFRCLGFGSKVKTYGMSSLTKGSGYRG